MATRAEFLKAYKALLMARNDWTHDIVKLNKFLLSVENTLCGGNSWNHDGDCCRAAWKAIGMKGKPTLKGLRALPTV